ncbi:MAG: TolC family protein [Pirellulales bacterium]|nr:TolC family protein [Pirellulales bacterium]
MSRRSHAFRTVACLLVAALTGCSPQQPFYLFEDGDLSHYRGMATELEVPDVDMASSSEVEGAKPPISLTNPNFDEVWELSLEEAVKIGLANSKMIRTINTSVFSDTLAPDSMTRAADIAPSIYDPALIETDPRFGPEAALSAFDTQFSTQVFWERNDRPINVGSGFGTIFARDQVQDLGTFQTGFSKFNATGGQSAIMFNSTYDQNNSPTRAFPSDWNVDLTAQFSQPLLAGSGVQFNRIAGPGAIPGFYNGVVIARINSDVALTDFENNVRNMVLDIERAYWDLYLAYRELDSVAAGRDSALVTWQRIKTLYDIGGEGGDLANLSQAQEQYFLFRAQYEDRKNEVFAAEAQLRYMLGLASTDGRLIRPKDEPTTAKLAFDWYESKCEALARNTDLRRQKWQIKKAELELIAAKNFLLPRLDVSGEYRWRGMGDHLWSAERQHLVAGDEFDNAFQSMTGGKYQEWNFGINLSMPLGFRKEMLGVRNAQLNIARAKTLLRAQELEVTHQLSYAIRSLEKGIVITRTNYNRVLAARKQVKAVQAAFEHGDITLNVVLDAQRRLAEAEIQYYRSVVQYNLALAEVHLRKGSLLEYNGVYLAEGPWPGKAYFDARRRARARDAACFLDYGFTRPKVISRGAYEQHAGRLPTGEDAVPLADPETIPTPAPLQPKPEADDANPGAGAVSKANQAWPHLFGNAGQRSGKSRSTAAGRLAARLDKNAGADTSEVRLVSFEPDSASSASARGQSKKQDNSAEDSSVGKWRSIKRGSGPANESFANPASAETAGTASRWSGIQR